MKGNLHVGIVILGIVADDEITVSSTSGPVLISTNINPPFPEYLYNHPAADEREMVVVGVGGACTSRDSERR